MATKIIVNGIEYDADTVIRQFLTSKGRNKTERDALLAEYDSVSDMSAGVEMIIDRYSFLLDGKNVEIVRQG